MTSWTSEYLRPSKLLGHGKNYVATRRLVVLETYLRPKIVFLGSTVEYVLACSPNNMPSAVNAIYAGLNREAVKNCQRENLSSS
jgi:hypothetical protein